jgi:hypothetical protein
LPSLERAMKLSSGTVRTPIFSTLSNTMIRPISGQR